MDIYDPKNRFDRMRPCIQHIGAFFNKIVKHGLTLIDRASTSIAEGWQIPQELLTQKWHWIQKKISADNLPLQGGNFNFFPRPPLPEKSLNKLLYNIKALSTYLVSSAMSLATNIGHCAWYLFNFTFSRVSQIFQFAITMVQKIFNCNVEVKALGQLSFEYRILNNVLKDGSITELAHQPVIHIIQMVYLLIKHDIPIKICLILIYGRISHLLSQLLSFLCGSPMPPNLDSYFDLVVTHIKKIITTNKDLPVDLISAFLLDRDLYTKKEIYFSWICDQIPNKRIIENGELSTQQICSLRQEISIKLMPFPELLMSWLQTCNHVSHLSTTHAFTNLCEKAAAESLKLLEKKATELNDLPMDNPTDLFENIETKLNFLWSIWTFCPSHQNNLIDTVNGFSEQLEEILSKYTQSQLDLELSQRDTVTRDSLHTHLYTTCEDPFSEDPFTEDPFTEDPFTEDTFPSLNEHAKIGRLNNLLDSLYQKITELESSDVPQSEIDILKQPFQKTLISILEKTAQITLPENFISTIGGYLARTVDECLKPYKDYGFQLAKMPEQLKDFQKIPHHAQYIEWLLEKGYLIETKDDESTDHDLSTFKESYIHIHNLLISQECETASLEKDTLEKLRKAIDIPDSKASAYTIYRAYDKYMTCIPEPLRSYRTLRSLISLLSDLPKTSDQDTYMFSQVSHTQQQNMDGEQLIGYLFKLGYLHSKEDIQQVTTDHPIKAASIGNTPETFWNHFEAYLSVSNSEIALAAINYNLKAFKVMQFHKQKPLIECIKNFYLIFHKLHFAETCDYHPAINFLMNMKQKYLRLPFDIFLLIATKYWQPTIPPTPPPLNKEIITRAAGLEDPDSSPTQDPDSSPTQDPSP